MKKLSKILMVLLAGLNGSCSTINKNAPSKTISIQDIERITLDSHADQVIQILGEPSEKVDSRVGNQYLIIWNYEFSIEKVQRASLSLDPKSQRVVDKLLVPLEDEKESNMNYLLTNKFSQNKFQKVEFPRCGRDYTSDEAMLVDMDHSIWIRYRKNSNYVVAIGWGPPKQTKHDVEAILNCKTP